MAVKGTKVPAGKCCVCSKPINSTNSMPFKFGSVIHFQCAFRVKG